MADVLWAGDSVCSRLPAITALTAGFPDGIPEAGLPKLGGCGKREFAVDTEAGELVFLIDRGFN